MNIAGIPIGPDHPCRTIAELSNNANGSLPRALRICDAAKEAGADFLKLQAYLPEELVALRGDGPAPDPWGKDGWSMRDLYTKAATPYNWFPAIAAHCADIGLPWFSSVFGLKSLAVLEDNGCPAYKIAALDNHHVWLYEACHATGKPVLVSTRHRGGPMLAAPYLPTAMLYCPPGYPTRAEDVNLPSVFIEGCDGWPIGLSSHCLDPLLPVAAVARGAKLIEAHFHLGGSEASELEANISLDPEQWRSMVDSIRRTETLLGDL